MNNIDRIKNHNNWFDKKAIVEFNNGKIVVEEKKERSLNELYYKLLQLGQIGQATGRQSQYHGNREAVLSMIKNGNCEYNPVYMEDTEVADHINRAEEQLMKKDKMEKRLKQKRAEKIVEQEYEKMEQARRIEFLDNMMNNRGVTPNQAN